MDLRRQQDIEREAFKEQSEAPVRSRPRDVRRLHAAGVTLQAQDARLQQGLELTRIQMPPRASFVMVINGRWRVTGRTAKESHTRGMRQHDSDFGFEVIDLHRGDKPRSGKAEDLLVKFS